MNAVEIEEAVSLLAEQPFEAEADTFPYAFLEAFGNKATTIKRLKSGTTNKSDIGGVLQRGNIHIKTCAEGEVAATLDTLRDSPATKAQKAKFTLATDGIEFQAEDLEGGETVACAFPDFADHFGFFLELAGISTVRAIKESSFDIKATGRLNKLYIELLQDNPEWASSERRHDLNHFLARLIFCFFAEDTDIFLGDDLFTATVEQMSERDSSNTHEIIAELFRSMDTKPAEREKQNIRSWANVFPYVNGELFRVVDPTVGHAVPHFSKIARSYLSHIGKLNWTKINPDIFGSMIQAVADDEERGSLGMHYTSVPNILKVLNPLFLDDLRTKLEEAADNTRKLLNLRTRIAHIRVFDPACGSGNFLVIAYKEMRQIEAEINQRRGEKDLRSAIDVRNFRGIELRHFSAEIARLALIIAEYQCDVTYRGQKEALAEFLPLDRANWITCGNALQLDWLSVCPPTGTEVKHRADDLFKTPLDQAEIEFRNEGGETYICGNPPYKGSKWQKPEQKLDLKNAWSRFPQLSKTTDLVTGWIAKYLNYTRVVNDAKAAFVVTNSVCQGQQASDIWSVVFSESIEINFAQLPFKWRNLASHNAGVTVIIIGLGVKDSNPKQLFDKSQLRVCDSIGPYLVPNSEEIVDSIRHPTDQKAKMLFGNMPRDGGHLFLTSEEAQFLKSQPSTSRYVKKFYGSKEFINGKERFCLWINDIDSENAKEDTFIAKKLQLVSENRTNSKAPSTQAFATQPHRFVQRAGICRNYTIVIPGVSSESRSYLPCGLLGAEDVISNKNFGMFDAPLWNMALIASRLHWVWIGTVCVRMRTDFSYSNTLGWNTFPVPTLTENDKAALTKCAEDILLAREAHFPATIADLYKPDTMPDNLRAAHERNDETLERIYIGRRFKNDTERLEKLFDLYTKMTTT